MARRRAPRSEMKNTVYEIFVGLLSILSIVNIALDYIFRNDQSLQIVLAVMDGLFSVIFLTDFIYRITTAPSASRYFFRQYGWADLLASLPFQELKILRLFRVLRVVRLLRKLGPGAIWRSITRDRANSALMTLLLMGILVLQFGSLAILRVEQYAEGANITTASDALWYTIVTISTVGYGDHFPVTNPGKWIGTLIIIIGVGIFGTFTGYLANAFLGPSKKDEPVPAEGEAPLLPQPDASHTAAGVAAGGAAGAVTAGAAAGDGDAPAPTATTGSAQANARIAELLAQSEQALAEARRIFAESSRE
ncbi:ion transporter [Microbacterium mangrovi]|uniref:ion transporter n=1 Tax=Microbacterium mangrovi TaxID=1348253 RepID=UPI000AC0146B|nr:ion transporter [Microbacterium mangrovi]